MSNPFAVTIATLPIIAAVFYFLAFGFKHWWFTAGFGAWITLASVALMACEFSVRGVIIVVVISVLATPPLVWLARRYIPG